MELDASLIIDKLVEEISKLTLEKAILQAQIEQIEKERQEESQGKKEGLI